MMSQIALFDSSIATDNLGDQIIMEAVKKSLREIAPSSYLFSIPSHDFPGQHSIRVLRNCDFAIVGGTNILTSHWWWYKQWKIGVFQVPKVNNAVLCGVGWHKYQNKPDWLTSRILRQLLSDNHLHAVRDKYTASQLAAAGLSNVLYTACPTMWDLTKEFCRQIPTQKSRNVILTLTAYLKRTEEDKYWIQQLASHYDKMYFWPQMPDDVQYGREILPSDAIWIPPHLESYKEALLTTDCDYVGTRLHGGIQALQLRRRALIIEVDNRAKEIARDTGLSTIAYQNITEIPRWIAGSETDITLPEGNIKKWKQQFFRGEQP